MVVVKIEKQKALEIKGTLYTDGIYYNPVQDSNGNWVISTIEGDHLFGELTGDEFEGKEYELIEFSPVIVEEETIIINETYEEDI